MLLLLASAWALAQEPPAPAEHVQSTVLLNVRAEPSGLSRLRGRLVPGAAVAVLGTVEGPGCEEGWAVLAGQGYACRRWLSPAEGPAPTLPRLVPFDPPEPGEYAAYRDTGAYDRAPAAQADALLPFVYGKRWRHWQGQVYASAEHYAHGDPPVDQLDRGSKHAFLGAVDTPRGQVLLQEDGSVVPADDVFLYPVDRFQGWDLVAAPVPEGRLPAFAFRYEGARLRAEPSAKAEVVATVAWHERLLLDAAPASPDGRWWRVPDGLGPGVDAYVEQGSDVRRWVPAPAPPEVPPGQPWLDVDRDQQLAALRQGEELVYLTLVSTGTGGRYETPAGTFRLMDQAAWGDMASLPGAEEEYHVEKVPWVAHFKPRFALHGVFWHWGFGHRASHGCINLAPRDAAWLLARLEPSLPPGWHTVFADPAHPGSVVRVR
ncbi:L,D-transpeptidase [Myxococcota bacterium]|nr:L,D-transpeptidase [Myxococcota bacterium]